MTILNLISKPISHRYVSNIFQQQKRSCIWNYHYSCFHAVNFVNANRSPYVVLQIKTSATKDVIKASFRRLAKIYHPDINGDLEKIDAETKMSEIIEAYDQLMNDDFGSKVRDSQVAFACEIYTIDELKMDRLYDVYAIKLNFEGEDIDEKFSQAASNFTSFDISEDSILEIVVHPNDSVSDLKRTIQSLYIDEWGLVNRKLDRDKIATGWELVSKKSGEVLSYHLFLHSYGIRNKDIVYAVVKKY